MKRFALFIILLFLAFSIVACGEAEKAESIPGTSWKSSSGETYTALYFNEDGSGKFNEGELDFVSSKSFTYTVNDDAITIATGEGKTVECVFEIEKDQLTISTHYSTNIYERIK